MQANMDQNRDYPANPPIQFHSNQPQSNQEDELDPNAINLELPEDRQAQPNEGEDQDFD